MACHTKNICLIFVIIHYHMVNRNQQRVAETVAFDCWHFVQIRSVSLQLSVQHEMQQKMDITTVTQPHFFAWILSVFWLHLRQNAPFPVPLFAERFIIIGPC